MMAFFYYTIIRKNILVFIVNNKRIGCFPGVLYRCFDRPILRDREGERLIWLGRIR